MYISNTKGGNRAHSDMIPVRHAPASNTAAVVTITGVPGMKICLHKIISSYDADPTGGSVLIESPASTTKKKYFVVKGGPVPITLAPYTADAGVNVVVTLAAGGNGITGILEVDYDLTGD